MPHMISLICDFAICHYKKNYKNNEFQPGKRSLLSGTINKCGHFIIT